MEEAGVSSHAQSVDVMVIIVVKDDVHLDEDFEGVITGTEAVGVLDQL